MSDIREASNRLMEAFEDFRRLVEIEDKNLYNRWHAGGCMVSSDFVHMYGNVEEITDLLDYDEDECDEEDEECDEEDECEEDCHGLDEHNFDRPMGNG